MGRKVRISKGKQMKPNFFVFCEGETEIAYVKFLRSLYRAPIQVIVKKGKSNISEDYIERSQNEYVRTEQDKVFLMYDLDVDGMLEQLQKIPNAELLVSNPCVELWFLLHYQEQRSWKICESDQLGRRLHYMGVQRKRSHPVYHQEQHFFRRV